MGKACVELILSCSFGEKRLCLSPWRSYSSDPSRIGNGVRRVGLVSIRRLHMMMRSTGIFPKRARDWMLRIGFWGLIPLFLSACVQNPSYLYEAGENPIPPGIENEIHPHKTSQDDVLALLGEPVARLKVQTPEGHVHTWTYSYLDLKRTPIDKSESLTITFDDKKFLVISVKRGPL